MTNNILSQIQSHQVVEYRLDHKLQLYQNREEILILFPRQALLKVIGTIVMFFMKNTKKNIS